MSEKGLRKITYTLYNVSFLKLGRGYMLYSFRLDVLGLCRGPCFVVPSVELVPLWCLSPTGMCGAFPHLNPDLILHRSR